jgi:hypothetical protein
MARFLAVLVALAAAALSAQAHTRVVSGALRLRGGPVPSSGRVEIYYNNTWGTVTAEGIPSEDWTHAAAKVVCRQLGYGHEFARACYASRLDDENDDRLLPCYGPGSGRIWATAVNCTGDEERLVNCTMRLNSTNSAVHEDDLSVICDGPAIANGTIRLVGGPSPSAGRLEIFHDNAWGTVCDGSNRNDPTHQAASVVCRELGFNAEHAYACYAPANDEGESYLAPCFGPGEGTIWLSGVNCRGNETALTECEADDWDDNDCNHFYDDLSIVCGAPGVDPRATSAATVASSVPASSLLLLSLVVFLVLW